MKIFTKLLIHNILITMIIRYYYIFTILFNNLIVHYLQQIYIKKLIFSMYDETIYCNVMKNDQISTKWISNQR